MDIILNHTINETFVVLDISETDYGYQSRSDHAAILYVNTKKTTGDVPINTITPNIPDPRLVVTWTLPDLTDGYDKAEILMVPIHEFIINYAEENSYVIVSGTVIYHDGVFYRAMKNIPESWYLPTPDIDYNNWEVINTTNITDVYDEAFMASLPDHVRTFYGFDEFVFYNNLMYAFLNKSAEITKSCNICANPQIEELRCLRDKYESVELAVAALNYSGAQTIIESSENLVNSCSC